MTQITYSVTTHSALNAEHTQAVLALVDEAAAVDAKPALNEAAILALRGDHPATHLLAQGETGLSGYAQVDPRDQTVQLVVAPDQRRQGIATVLTERIVASDQPAGWWAFGTLEPAAAFANTLGLVPGRRLLMMVAEPPHDLKPTRPSATITLSTLRPDDVEALVEVNAAAFAAHPEQGAMTVADVHARMTEPWFRAEDVLLAKDETGRVIGFHWMKIADGVGEVYVIGVHPNFAGGGVGRTLLETGMVHMAESGVRVIELYVEAANERVVSMYEAAGFRTHVKDTLFIPAIGGQQE